MHGFLNNVKHTSNTIDYLKQHVGERYTGDSNYVDQQAVRDGKIITANGTGQLEFCREILYALEADTAEAIEKVICFIKTDSVRSNKSKVKFNNYRITNIRYKNSLIPK